MATQARHQPYGGRPAEGAPPADWTDDATGDDAAAFSHGSQGAWWSSPPHHAPHGAGAHHAWYAYYGHGAARSGDLGTVGSAERGSCLARASSPA